MLLLCALMRWCVACAQRRRLVARRCCWCGCGSGARAAWALALAGADAATRAQLGVNVSQTKELGRYFAINNARLRFHISSP
jgi:hypothetical protein